MAITVQYVVTHKDVEKLVTTDKKAADQYDKMLDAADNLAGYLTAMGIKMEEDKMEELSILLAKNKDAVTKLLKGSALDNVLDANSAEVVKLQAGQ
ncbi:YebG family protein [Salinimonas marina]|uniref:YebG family protein n=1 Tax=Salinimonas marina TaxID=2785918 RepID=A0A7S9DX01_9ALTE|nr:YebG family protein [Salinimonas marina]QPG05489.1 YebG family protein [Salinimonas marina]